jgi:hypothetical protein
MKLKAGAATNRATEVGLKGGTAVAVATPGEEEETVGLVVVAVSHHTGSSNGIFHSGIHGIVLLAPIQLSLGTGHPMGLSHNNKKEFLGPNLSRLLLMSTLLVQLTLQMLSAPSILLSQTPLGTWTPELPHT